MIRPRLDVATPVFDGPLELLLALVEREEIDVFEVPLATVTDAYLAELATLTELDAAEMAEFLWLAARLLLLKSIRLLPGEEPEPEEVELLGWEEDVRRRMLEYRAYREVAEQLMARAASDPTSFTPPAREIEVEGQEEPLPLDALVVAFQSVLARIPPRPVVFKGTGWTMEMKVELLRLRLSHGPFDLIAVLLQSEDRLEAVITFVAVLDLLRRGEIRVRQRASFDRLMVEPAG